MSVDLYIISTSLDALKWFTIGGMMETLYEEPRVWKSLLSMIEGSTLSEHVTLAETKP